MVATAVESVAGVTLAAAPSGRWSGRRFVCRYRIGSGELRVRVDVAESDADAIAAFTAARPEGYEKRRLFGIGDDGYTRRSGTVVAVTDNFVLTVDPTGLARGLDRDVVAWATTRAIFDCW